MVMKVDVVVCIVMLCLIFSVDMFVLCVLMLFDFGCVDFGKVSVYVFDLILKLIGYFCLFGCFCFEFEDVFVNWVMVVDFVVDKLIIG